MEPVEIQPIAEARPVDRTVTASTVDLDFEVAVEPLKPAVSPYQDIVDVLEWYIELNRERQVDRETLENYVTWVYDNTNSEEEALWVLAMMWVESRLQADATSSQGAVGLLQMMPSTAKGLGYTVEEIRDPKTNIEVCIAYFHDLLDTVGGDRRLATIAYHQGITNVKRGTYKPWYHDGTEDFVGVKGHYEALSSEVEKLRYDR